jgi:cytoskeleton protein RodZ
MYAVSGTSGSGLGASLRTAREALSVSVAQIANTLKLPVRIIECIETNDFKELPSPAFTRGYIRAYAKLIELDADQFVRDYDTAEGMDNEPALVVEAQKTDFRELPQRYPGWVLGGSVVVVGVIAVLVLWIVWPETDAADSSRKVEIPFTEPFVDSFSDFGEDSPDSAHEIRVAASGTSETLVSGADVRQPDRMDEVVVRTVFPEGAEALVFQQHLKFEFSNDCWVEVRDRTGLIYTDLNRRGQDLSLRGEAPFTITLGYVPGVYLEYNDEPVALSPHTRNNVATLVLGQ